MNKTQIFVGTVEMDMLVVAAAAGAGCLAKYWRDTFEEKGLQSGSPGNAFAQLQNSGTENSGFSTSFDDPYSQKIAGREESSITSERNQKQFSDCSGEPEALHCIDGYKDAGPLSLVPDLATPIIHRNSDDIVDVQDRILQGMASTSGVDTEPLMSFMRHEGHGYSYFPASETKDRDLFEINNSTNGFHYAKKDSPDFHQTGNTLSRESTPRLADGCQRFGRKKSIPHRRWSHGYPMKQMTALESCLVAQMYKDPVEMEDYVFGSPRSLSVRTLQPFVTEGYRVGGSTTTEQLEIGLQNGVGGTWLRNGFDSADNSRTLTGIPPLPAMESRGSHRKEKHQIVKVIPGKRNASSTSHSAKDSRLQGSIDGALLFCFGIGVGVMSAVLSNKHEVDRLNELLRQTENLVQDLQEELEMKDSLTVEELASESFAPSGRNADAGSNKKSIRSCLGKEPDECCHCTEKDRENQKFGTDPDESMRKIEAELETELEKLELNLSSFDHKRRLSGLSELDPDSTIDIVQSELRADLVVAEPETKETNLDASDSSTPAERADYAVSPRELSLRLHQVLQSRLEHRIAELETALQQSQKRLDTVDNLERKPSRLQTRFSSSDISTTPVESLTLTSRTRGQLNFQASITRSVTDEEEDNNNPAHSLNPSHDTFVSYNAVLDEFMIMAESENEGSQARHCSSEPGEENGLTSLCQDQQHREDEDEDEVGRLLIKHILESKKGSLAMEVLLSLDDSLPLE